MSQSEEAEPPAQTRVGCCNTVCRWIGCCDACSTGDGPPNLREGVLKNRSCTDIPWFLGCIAFSIIVFIVIWQPAYMNVNMDRFSGPSDYQMNFCGQAGTFVEDYPYGAFPDVTKPKIKVCVKSCDDTVPLFNHTSKKLGIRQFKYCVPVEKMATVVSSLGGGNLADIYEQRQVPIAACAFTFLYLFVFFIFVFFFLKFILIALYLGVLAATAFGSYYFMKDGYDFGADIAAFEVAGWPRISNLGRFDISTNAVADPTAFYTGIGVLCGGILLWCCMMCFWTTLFNIVDKMQMASKALLAMPHLLTVPLITFPFSIGVLSAFCLVTVAMYSSGQYQTESISPIIPDSGLLWSDVLKNLDLPYADHYGTDLVTATYQTPDSLDNVTLGVEFFINLFWMFWGLKIIDFFNFLVVSGCVADWYLDKELVDNPEANNEFKKGACGGNCCRIFKAIWRAIRYHLGTIAFAAALVAAIQTVTAILVYVKQQIGDTENPFAKLILKVVMGVMKCLECIMNRCSKSTLVVTAVLGSPFCAGCGKTLQMFFNNMATMGLGTGMIMFLCMLSNIMIALFSSGTAGALYLGVRGPEDIKSNVYPLVFSLFCSFFIARLLLTVWDCAATTVLVCGVMLKEWYPDEYGKHLGRKAVKVDRKNDDNEAEQIEIVQTNEIVQP